MNDLFVQRVRCASWAAWWAVVIGAIWLTVGWLLWLALLAAEPGWLLTLWGGHDLTWSQVHGIWLRFMAAAKLILLVCVLVSIYLTLWSRRLARAGGGQ